LFRSAWLYFVVLGFFGKKGAKNQTIKGEVPHCAPTAPHVLILLRHNRALGASHRLFLLDLPMSLTLREALQNLTVPDLKDLMVHVPQAPTGTRKDELVEHIAHAMLGSQLKVDLVAA
jgi:hypothetical protein